MKLRLKYVTNFSDDEHVTRSSTVPDCWMHPRWGCPSTGDRDLDRGPLTATLIWSQNSHFPNTIKLQSTCNICAYDIFFLGTVFMQRLFSESHLMVYAIIYKKIYIVEVQQEMRSTRQAKSCISDVTTKPFWTHSWSGTKLKKVVPAIL